jgi:hypothetical protein
VKVGALMGRFARSDLFGVRCWIMFQICLKRRERGHAMKLKYLKKTFVDGWSVIKKQHDVYENCFLLLFQHYIPLKVHLQYSNLAYMTASTDEKRLSSPPTNSLGRGGT